MANLEAGMPVFVRLHGRLGHVVAYAGADGAGENIYDVRLDDDGQVVAAGESSLGDPSEANLPKPVGEAEPSALVGQVPVTEAPATVTEAPESVPEAPTEPVAE